MAETVGIPLKDFAKAIIVSYRKGLEDSIKHLHHDLDTMDIEAMEKDIIKTLQEQGKIKAGW